MVAPLHRMVYVTLDTGTVQTFPTPAQATGILKMQGYRLLRRGTIPSNVVLFKGRRRAEVALATRRDADYVSAALA